MTPEQEREMRALEYIYDNDEESRGGASIGGLRKLLGEDAAARAATSLRQGGLIITDGRLSGGYHITGDGRTSVEKMRDRRTDRGYRRKLCREALLRWVDSNTNPEAARNRISTAEFKGSADLVPFSDAETNAAASFLVENGFIESLVGDFQGHHISLWITERGQEAVDEGGIEKYQAKMAPPSIATTNFHFGGSGNTYATATAAGAVANAHVTNFNLDHARLFAAAVRAAEADLTLSDEARAALAEIESSGEDKERASRATKVLYSFLMGATTGTVGQVLGMLGASALGIAS